MKKDSRVYLAHISNVRLQGKQTKSEFINRIIHIMNEGMEPQNLKGVTYDK